MEEMRLQKYLASAGVDSRRKCEEYIQDGLVTVNGETVYELGTKVTPNKDIVTFKGKQIDLKNEKHTYVLLNKPLGYVTTAKEQFGRDKVTDLVKINKRLVPVRKT